MVKKHFFPIKRITTLSSVLVLALGSLAVASCGQESHNSTAEAAPTPAQSAKPVKTISVTSQTIEDQTEMPARTHAFAEAEIRPQVTGLIKKRLFEEGANVKEGQALYQIEDTEYVARVDSAKAELSRSEATIDIAKQNEARYTELIKSNAVSQQEYDEVVSIRKQAEADLAAKRSALTQAQIDLKRTKVVSPINGRIGRSSVTAGALVTQNQTTSLARVLQLDPIYVDLATSSSEVLKYKQDVQAGRIQTNANKAIPVSIVYENGDVHSSPGELKFSEISVDETSGTVILRAIVPNPDNLLMPGMYVKARVSAGQRDNVILVPQSAVSRTPRGEPYAMVVDDNGLAETRMLTLAGASGNNWIIESGLDSGDNLIVDGLLMLRSGMPVQAVNPDNNAIASAESNSPLKEQ